jgi:hypothetical protein
MPERPRRPDLDERFSLDEDPEDVLSRLLDGEGGEEVSDEPEGEEAES